jgi:hypothetical protein
MGPNKPIDKRPEEKDQDKPEQKDSAPAKIPERELDNLPGDGGSFEKR